MTHSRQLRVLHCRSPWLKAAQASSAEEEPAAAVPGAFSGGNAVTRRTPSANEGLAMAIVVTESSRVKSPWRPSLSSFTV